MFDTIIAGGGTAGCVLANRLCASGERVALIEAGPDFGHSESGSWPAELNGPDFVLTPYDWDSTIAPYGEDIRLLRGRTIGGSSTINATGINWGLRSDYGEWVDHGVAGWSFEELEPFFLKAERLLHDDAPHRGHTGKVGVTRALGKSPFFDDLQASFAAAGFPGPIDPGGPDALEGWGFGTRNVEGNVRNHAARAYLDEVRDQPNLTIFSDTLVDRVLWDGATASGVAVIQNDERVELNARRVVLAGGAVGSPQILLRSGIGDAAELAPVLGSDAALHHLPGVGKNLHDHYGTRLFMQTTPDFAERLAARGHATTDRQSLFTRVKSDPSKPAYDLTIGMSHADTALPDDLLAITVFLVNLVAEGSVTITDADPHAQPVVDLDIGRTQDLDAIAGGLQWLRERLSHPAMREWFVAEAVPGEQDVREHIKQNIFLFHHATGTAKMGPATDPLAVTGLDGRVHGFENLYVGDASLLPTIPRGMIILTVYAVAEKIAAGLVGTAD